MVPKSLVALSLFASLLSGQTVIVDWGKKAITSGKEMALDKPTKVWVRVTNANTFVYNYRVIAVPVRVQYDDIQAFGPLFRPESPATCEQKQIRIREEGESILGAMKVLRKDAAVRSIPWAKSKEIYDEQKIGLRTQELAALEGELMAQCSNFVDSTLKTPDYLKFRNKLAQLADAAAGKIIPSAETVVGPGFGLQIEVIEEFKKDDGESVETAHFSETIEDVSLPVLFLSGGFLLTRIEDRGYARAEVPEGNSISKVLGVSAAGWPRPLGVALLNYSVPGLDPRMRKGNLGVSLALGPTVRFDSGKSDVSNFGLFLGVSLDFWKRLFITPGIHVGQFADFPTGLPRPGIPIPQNFGDLVPLKRWTGRFGVGVTVRARSFSNLFGATKSDSGTAAGDKKPAQGAKPEAPAAEPPKEERRN